MKIKTVKRYYCGFCNKSGGSRFHMEKHERGCTLNPTRQCGICDKMDADKTPRLAELLQIIGDKDQYEKIESERGLGFEVYTFVMLDQDKLNAMLPKLREAANDCPACIMAALRQSGVPVPAVTHFDYKKELDIFWSNYNDDKQLDGEE